MNSVTANNPENRVLAVAAMLYCGVLLAVLAIGLYGVFSLFQLMFGSLEQTARMHTWL
jgi:hypothetical protein